MTAYSNASSAFQYGYIVGRAAVEALQHSQYADRTYTTPSQLVDAWYTVSVMTSGSITLGPYYNRNCTAGDTTACECNQGVRTMAIANGLGVNEVMYTNPNCYVVYQSLRDLSVLTGSVAGAAGFVILVILILATILLFKTARNNLAAPKNPNKPFCILFTDIQSSTHLWATAPEEMAHALHAHHTIIRRLINKFGCYEVKTIGDSFMCAVQSPGQAVGFALAVQREFHTYDWGSGAINDSYRKNLDTDAAGMVSPTCWNGLRIRVGIHFGMGDILRDPVSKGFDYYGTVVNTAARIESVCHGGQVAVSHTVHKELDGRYPDSVWTDLGLHALRGLPEPIHLFQILPAGPLGFREFPSLRIDHADQMAAQQEDGDDLEVVYLQPVGKSNRVSVASVDQEAKETLSWTETHPLVLRGDVTAEELRKAYTVALNTVATLLATQTKKARETVVPLLCDRLHVRSWGSEGRDLQRTLRALVRRVLPAVVSGNSCMGTPSQFQLLLRVTPAPPMGDPALCPQAFPQSSNVGLVPKLTTGHLFPSHCPRLFVSVFRCMNLPFLRTLPCGTIVPWAPGALGCCLGNM
eukprot:TRINITY_DN1619_c0_g1_i4.p1 TRINITY_DN1619_c0_g1~~TRINITY_DN1619_c0_g1_i4.p1  ORF type:complete len:580 (-),score=121.20 TRINITY_DN1619_c0_g1_i4:293-2032(-)